MDAPEGEVFVLWTNYSDCADAPKQKLIASLPKDLFEAFVDKHCSISKLGRKIERDIKDGRV